MSLKLPSIFIICILSMISIHSVFATTADDFLTRNPSAMDIQAAIDNGSINYSDLPPSFQINIHDHQINYNQWLLNHQNNSTVQSQTNQPSKPIDFTSFLIPLVGVLIPIILVIFRSILGTSDDEPDKPNRLHKILFHIGLAKKVDDDGEKDRWSKTVSEDKDLTGLDDSFNEHDYSEDKKPKKSKAKVSKTIRIKSHHSILVSLGLAKVVKKE